MAEYIGREAFLKDIEERYCLPCKEAGKDHNGCMCRACWVDDMRGDVIDAPAVDVAPVVHGRWVAQCVVETDGGWTLEDMPYNEYQHSNPICSICRKTALLDGGEDYVASPYCPNCGARMNGGSYAKEN